MKAFSVEPSRSACGACSSKAGTANGVCVVCGCPSSARQLQSAPQRALAFGAVVTIRGPNTKRESRGPQPLRPKGGRLEWRAGRLREALAAGVPALLPVLEERRRSLISEMVAAGWTQRQIDAALELSASPRQTPTESGLFDVRVQDGSGHVA